MEHVLVCLLIAAVAFATRHVALLLGSAQPEGVVSAPPSNVVAIAGHSKLREQEGIIQALLELEYQPASAIKVQKFIELRQRAQQHALRYKKAKAA